MASNPKHHNATSGSGASSDGKDTVDRPPPKNYVCRLCGTPGHWIKDCSRASDRKRKSRDDEAFGSGEKDAAPKRAAVVRTECTFWAKGACRNGASCPFSHATAPDLSETVCRFHVTGHCLKGDSCPFSHDLSQLPCMFHHGVEGRCGKGASCPFSHDPLTERQRAYLIAAETRREERAAQALESPAPAPEPVVAPWSRLEESSVVTVSQRPMSFPANASGVGDPGTVFGTRTTDFALPFGLPALGNSHSQPFGMSALGAGNQGRESGDGAVGSFIARPPPPGGMRR